MQLSMNLALTFEQKMLQIKECKNCGEATDVAKLYKNAQEIKSEKIEIICWNCKQPLYSKELMFHPYSNNL